MILYYIFILLLNLQITFIADNKQINVTHQLINNTIYIYLEDIPQIISPTYHCEVSNGVIYTDDFTLKTAPNSFYIVYSNSDSLRVGQMTLPTLIKNNKVLIPIFSFLDVMKGLNQMDFYYKDDNVVITKNIIPKKINTINEMPISTIQPNKKEYFEDSNNTKDIILQYDSTIKKVPNYYEVPKNIKRKGIK